MRTFKRGRHLPERLEHIPDQVFKGYVNWYQNESGGVFGGGILCREDSEKAKRFIDGKGSKWIACTYVEIKEERI